MSIEGPTTQQGKYPFVVKFMSNSHDVIYSFYCEPFHQIIMENPEPQSAWAVLLFILNLMNVTSVYISNSSVSQSSPPPEVGIVGLCQQVILIDSMPIFTGNFQCLNFLEIDYIFMDLVTSTISSQNNLPIVQHLCTSNIFTLFHGV